MGDVADFGNFRGAVIDRRAFDKLAAALELARGRAGRARRRHGRRLGRLLRAARPWSVGTDPTHEMFRTEYFGPMLAVHVYDDGDFDTRAAQVDSGAPYALTGAIFARDRAAMTARVGGAALRRRQLLRQRQADRRGRRASSPSAAAGRQRHQRQGRLGPQPAALGQPADDQGDLRARRPPWATRTRADCSSERSLVQPVGSRPFARADRAVTPSAATGWPARSPPPSPRSRRRAPGSRPARLHDPLQDRAARRARERVPVLARGRVGGERGGEVVGHDEVLDVVEQRPRPVGLGRLDHRQPGRAISPAA